MFLNAWLVFVLGLLIGSFLNVVIYRLPRGESVVWGRSHCPACGKVLAGYDLVPVLSYLVLRGRCRYCRAAIPPRYPGVELLTGAAFAAFFFRFGPTLLLAKYLFLTAVLVVAALIDLDHYLIPDRLVAVALGGGVVLNLFTRDLTLFSITLGIVSAAGFLLLLGLVSRGGMGGGDVKLAAACGLFLGWPLALLGVFIGCCLAGGAGIWLILSKKRKREDVIPFGPFLALGTYIAVMWGPALLQWYLARFVLGGFFPAQF